MKERPILFNAAVVRALLDGSKTQTRRVLKQAKGLSLSVDIPDETTGVAELSWLYGDGPGYDVHEEIKREACPYGQPGDRLWVRESFMPIPLEAAPVPGQTPWSIAYAAGGQTELLAPSSYNPTLYNYERWTPSIHMPRWASRITLQVTGVRVERLQDISMDDARAEGAPPSHPSIDRVSREFGYPDFTRSWYGQLWEEINGAGSWDLNPWVWVVEFKAIEAKP